METKTFIDWVKYFNTSIPKKIEIKSIFRCQICGEEDKSKQNNQDDVMCNSCYDKSADVILY